MNLTKIFRTVMVLLVASLGLAIESHAAVTAVFSAGATCGGATPASFVPGASFDVSLCMTTTAPTTTCGHTINLQSTVAQSGNFVITAVSLGAAYNDPNSGVVPLPFTITSGPATADFGGTIPGSGPYAPVASSANQRLATFTIAPQPGANDVVISLSSTSIIAVDADGFCGATTVPTELPISASFNLIRNNAPVFTSSNAATFSTATNNSFTVTAVGSPTPTLSLTNGSLPGGVTFSAGSGLLQGQPAAGGPFVVTFTANNGVGAPVNQTFTLTVSGLASQVITFPNPGSQPFGSNKITMTAASTSGLAITYSALQTNPQACSVFGSLVTMLQPGTCTIRADQGGGGGYSPAAQVSQPFTISGSVPGAPTIGTVVNGNGQATISFTAPASNGGFPIAGYTLTCGAINATGLASPITIMGLTNGQTYNNCSVVATNSLGNSLSSASVTAMPSAAGALALVGAQSRKSHAGSPFDQAIDWTIPITGSVSVEPRQIGSGFNIVFQFNGPINSVGAATSLDASMAAVGTPGVPTFTPGGNEVVVPLTGVANGKRATITLNGVNGGGPFTASLAFLVGDVNGDRVVDVFDVIAVKTQSGKALGQLNFTRDLTADGSIDVFDVIAVKVKSGTTAP